MKFRRHGFTLVELLTAVAIIGVLMAIALPAVNVAREATRRTQCTAKLSQLVIAIENHQSAHDAYPPGRFLGEYGSGPDSTAWSWMAMTLPYMEEQAVYDSGNIPIETLEDSEATNAHIASFICPSADGDYLTPTTNAGNVTGFPVGQTTYKGVSGSNWGADRSLKQWSVRTPFRNEGTNGSFDGLGNGDGNLWRSDIANRNSQRHIADGTSKTFIVGEDLPRYNIWSSWPYSNNAYGTCAIPPNHIPDDVKWQYESYSFRSDHPGGLNFAFADGSVRFIADSVDLEVYRAMATRSGSEKL